MVVHVSGKRMILIGIDGVSRGNMNAGVMAGADMLSYVPLHLSSLQRSPSLRGWLEEWIGDGGLFLEAADWLQKHFNHGTYVWSPPPAAAPAALEWLGGSIRKRPTSVHVIVIPRLLTALWRKQMGKLSDVMLTVPMGCNRSSVRLVQKTSTRWWTTRTRKGSWWPETAITLCVCSSVMFATFGIFSVARREKS